MPSRRRSPARGPQQQVPVQAGGAPVQAQTTAMLWGMPSWVYALVALLLSMALQAAVNVYIDTSTQDIEKQLGALFAAGTPESIEMLAIADTIRSNQDFLFKSGLVITVLCFGPIIVMLFVRSVVMCGLRLFWGFVSHRYTIAGASVAAIYAYFF